MVITDSLSGYSPRTPHGSRIEKTEKDDVPHIPRNLQHFHYEEIMLGSSHGYTIKKKLLDTVTKELELKTMRQGEVLKLLSQGLCHSKRKQMKPEMKSRIKANQLRELS